jgi:hypothetical protein
MKRCLLILAAAVLVFAAVPVLAQEELDETYVAKDGTFAFNYPGTWELELDQDTVIIYSDEMTLYIYGPAVVEGWNWDTTDPTEIVQGIADQWEQDGFEVGNVKALTLNERDAAFVNYVDDGTPGMVVVVILSDGSLAAVDAVGNKGEKDVASRETVLAIAETIDVVYGGSPATVTLKDYDSGYRDSVAELRDLDLIPSGGSLLFEEDYAWFEGQGAFYTPLARNSPHLNFVMSGELSYHPSGGEGLETCTLGMRVVWSGRTTSEYVDVGYASGYGVFFWSVVDNNTDNNAVANIEVDITDPHVFTIIAIDDTMTVFVDGELAFDQVQIDKASGTWGVGLTGKGTSAKCEARDIWVYTLPE